MKKTNNYIIKTREELERSLKKMEFDYCVDREVSNALNKFPHSKNFVIYDFDDNVEIIPLIEDIKNIKVYAEHYFKTKGLTAEDVRKLWEEYHNEEHFEDYKGIYINACKTKKGEWVGPFVIRYKEDKREPYFEINYYYGSHGYGLFKTYLLK